MEYLSFATNHWELTLALVITLLMLVFNLYGHILKGYNIVSPEQAIRIINQPNNIVIDVREPKELTKIGKIAKSKNIALSALYKESANNIGDTKSDVIVVCRNGVRSAMACGKLKKKGFEKVHNLQGGIINWHKAGLPLTKHT